MGAFLDKPKTQKEGSKGKGKLPLLEDSESCVHVWKAWAEMSSIVMYIFVVIVGFAFVYCIVALVFECIFICFYLSSTLLCDTHLMYTLFHSSNLFRQWPLLWSVVNAGMANRNGRCTLFRDRFTFRFRRLELLCCLWWTRRYVETL